MSSFKSAALNPDSFNCSVFIRYFCNETISDTFTDLSEFISPFCTSSLVIGEVVVIGDVVVFVVVILVVIALVVTVVVTIGDFSAIHF